jgi:hypothetical protein
MEPENSEFIQPKTTAELLSAARREFINSNRYDGPNMIAAASLFDCIAKEVHGTRFIWSEYNREQWNKFVTLNNSYGGACAFSLEMDGEYESSREPFKGLFVGGPVGVYPYHIGPLVKAAFEDGVARAISKAGYHHSK